MSKVKIGGVNFNPAFAASGAMGNFGENYFHHKILSALDLLDKSGTTFVSKTATFYSRDGNMPYYDDPEKFYGTKELIPKCIQVDLKTGNTLNAVALSNPGLEEFLKTGLWQQKENPFWISIMSVAETVETRKYEMLSMIELINDYKYNFRTDFGLQINLSCPNTNHDPCALISEADEMVRIAGKLNVPIMAKFSIASAPIDALLELENNPSLDAICVSNTIPYGWQPGLLYKNMSNASLDWENIFGINSPLEKIGGGGLSGPVIKPFVLHYIKELRKAGFKKHINGGGGISCADDVNLYKKAGADSIFYGSVANTRPWRVEEIIKRADGIF